MLKKFLSLGLGVLAALLCSQPALASVESSLGGIKSALQTTIMPVLAGIGILLAGASLLYGHANAKNHITYALIGAAVIFGAQAIVDWISRIVR